VAGEAFGGLGFGVGDPLAEDKDPHPPFAAFLNMGGAGAMAGFAGILARRAARDAFLGVGGFQIALVVVFVAPFADFRPDDALTPSDLPRWQDAPEQHGNG